MGFKVKPRTYKLRFEDSEYDGAVVRARSFSTGEMLELQELQERATAGDPTAVRAVLVRVVDSLTDWNLEDENDDTLPLTIESLETLDFTFVLQVINGLMTAVASVPVPLPQRSNAGATSLEASIPMETL